MTPNRPKWTFWTQKGRPGPEGPKWPKTEVLGSLWKAFWSSPRGNLESAQKALRFFVCFGKGPQESSETSRDPKKGSQREPKGSRKVQRPDELIEVWPRPSKGSPKGSQKGLKGTPKGPPKGGPLANSKREVSKSADLGGVWPSPFEASQGGVSPHSGPQKASFWPCEGLLAPKWSLLALLGPKRTLLGVPGGLWATLGGPGPQKRPPEGESCI